MALGSNGCCFEPVLRRAEACHRAPRVTSLASPPGFFRDRRARRLGYVTGATPIKSMKRKKEKAMDDAWMDGYTWKRGNNEELAHCYKFGVAFKE